MQAKKDFGNELIKYILPALIDEDPDKIIERGSETNLQGQLNPLFEYLKESRHIIILLFVGNIPTIYTL